VRRASFWVVAVALVLPASAAAQPGLPSDAVQVAGPTASGGRLFVYDDRRGSLCGSVRRPGRRGFGTSCSSLGGGLRQPLVGYDGHPGRPRYMWGFVAPQVSAVELVARGGRRVRTQTTEGAAYLGRHAGEGRFFLMETGLRQGEAPLYLRLLDQAGGLLAAVEDESALGAEPVGATPVGRGRVAGTRWTLQAYRRPRLASLPGDEERLVRESCIRLLHHNGRFRGPRFEGPEACDVADQPKPDWALGVSRGCGVPGLIAIGLSPAGARGVVAVLGDGRRVRVPLRRLPVRFGESRRAFALVLGPRMAVRRVVALEEDGRRVLVGGLGPGIADCPNTTSSYVFAFPIAPPRPGPGPPALQVRDEGVLLCATVGRFAPGLKDCWRPPLDESEARILLRRGGDGIFVAGVLPSQVASVVLDFGGGDRQVVETTAEGPYAGRYQGYLRFFEVSVRGRRTLRATRLLDADGDLLVTLPAYQPLTFDAAPVTLLRATAGWRLGGAVLDLPRGRRQFLCLQFVRGAFERHVLGCGPGEPGTATFRVSCRPRGMFVYGRLREEIRGVEISTDRGSFRGRTVALRRRLGVPGRLFLVEVPASARPRSLVLHGRRTRRHRIRLPAAEAQCGYTEQFLSGPIADTDDAGGGSPHR
jgi:hypothetical protein